MGGQTWCKATDNGKERDCTDAEYKQFGLSRTNQTTNEPVVEKPSQQYGNGYRSTSWKHYGTNPYEGWCKATVTENGVETTSECTEAEISSYGYKSSQNSSYADHA